MEKTLRLKTSRKTLQTEIVIGRGFAFEKLLDIKEKKIAVITDSHLEKLYQSKIEAPVFAFQAGEASKNREVLAELTDHLQTHQYGRDTHLVALGGGVVTDMAGFLASIYCRGIDLTFIPTSLLGMVDAAIGGKVAINTPYGKNSVGAFYPPQQIWIDESFLDTLPKDEQKSGMAEVIKYGLIASSSLFFSLREESIDSVITQSMEIKKMIVEEDPWEEKGLRRILNFGHTFGHAFELLENYQLDHGSAVAIGMAGASWISHLRGYLSKSDQDEIITMIQAFGLPRKKLSPHSIDDLMSALARDKKASGGSPRFVLLKQLGTAHSFGGTYCTEVSFEEIENAYRYMYEHFGN